ncbi:MAG: PAS domain S-box protein [Acidobacteria bacterium]|nr:PAS domain S-box protein [Acidobacteriota bacterium]
MDNRRRSDQYMITVIIAGLVSVIIALTKFDLARADIYLLVLSVFTVAIGSRATIQIPRFKSHVSVSDTFIFLTLLLYGGEYAVVLAAIEATASSWRFCNRKLTVFFNAATMALATTAVILVLKAFSLYDDALLHGNGANRQSFVIALSVIALTQFITNTSLASIHGAIRDSIPLWETWKTKYVWTFFSYFIGAASAGVIVQISDFLGFGFILATLPVIFFVFLSYRMYLKNVDISMRQAEQAEQYAHILETQSDALRESEERFRSAFDYAPIGIGLVSPTGKWLKANRALTEILGYSEAEFLEVTFRQ